jgi:hypothetical protein
MAITHKGIKLLLDHHGLDPVEHDDEAVKNCLDLAIKNSDDMTPEEGDDAGDDSSGGDESLDNRARLAQLEAENAELRKKMKGAEKPLHVPNRARTPAIDVDAELSASQAEVKEAALIKNRAAELQKKGTPPATAWHVATKEIREELAAGMLK